MSIKLICVEISWLEKAERITIFSNIKDALAHACSECSDAKKKEARLVFNQINEFPITQSDGEWATIKFYDDNEITFNFCDLR